MATVVSTGLGERVLSGNVEAVAFDKLPIIDLAPLWNSNSSAAARVELAKAVQTASIQTGFFYIKNSGVSQDLLDRVRQKSAEFFDLPLEKKRQIDHALSDDFKGYVGMKGEQVDPNAKPDLHEAWDMGIEAPFTSKGSKQGNQFLPEQDCPGFKATMTEAFEALMRLGQNLFPIFAMALDLPEDYFADKLKNPGSIMRVLHYPPHGDGERDPLESGINQHTDYEVFTILAQLSDVEALQVANANGDWIPAPPIRDTLVLNLGDMLQRISNGVFKSTIHRVINSPDRHRYSMPLFFGLDYDAKLEPVPSCVTSSRPPMYEPITAGEYVQQRLKETYIKTDATPNGTH